MQYHAPKTYLWRPIIMLSDLVAIAAGLAIALTARGLSFNSDYLGLVAAFCAIYLYISESLNVYKPVSRPKINFFQTLMEISGAYLTAFVLLLTGLFFLKISTEYSRLALGIWFICSLSLICFWRWVVMQLTKAYYRAGLFQRKVAIYGMAEYGQKLQHEIVCDDSLGLEFTGFYDDRTSDRFSESESGLILGNSQDLIKDAANGKFDVLFIAIPFVADERVQSLLKILGDSTLDIHLVFEHRLREIMHGTTANIGPVTTLSVFDSPYGGSVSLIKRAEDIFLSLIFIFLSAIPMIAIYLAIKLTSKGPGIFKQTRYGMNGQPIQVWKFRTMTTEDNGDTIKQATKGDSRITPIGNILRKTSLDELPQFFNVLSGDMSIVGPRPHAVAHNEFYRKQIPYYMIRHKVKPGITGWAQINGWRGETKELYKMEKRVEYDLYYIRNWSLLLDLKVVLLTFFKGFVGKNTY